MLTVVILVLFFVLVWGVVVCVSACFFVSASACAEKLHDVL
ncbi:MAG: hypothetical protein ACO2PM_22115 [Pyrobaculum sp.]